jgi:hypothetical protein
MSFYEEVVIDYLKADRAIFVNTNCCIQINESNNLDNSGPHWYCDAIATDFRAKAVFLCEISYSGSLGALIKRLKGWHENWQLICSALGRDSFLPEDWPVRPWLFVPEYLVPLLLRRMGQIASVETLRFTPRITTLEMVQPWRYRSWHRIGESQKPATIPEEMIS